MTSTDDFPYQEFVQNRITMTPEKFGLVGAFCRSTLSADLVPDIQARFMEQQLVRLTMQVMSGRTVTEHPEVTFTYYTPDTWWDHVKKALWDWRDKQNARWEGTGYDGQPDTPPPWMILLWPFLVLFPRWGRRYPPRTTPKVVTTTVNFTQKTLYPEMDHVPADFGRSVIYETFEVPGIGAGFGLGRGTYDGRFMSKHEIVSEIYRDPEMFRGYPGGAGSEIIGVLNWLERHGVNPDQLVKRR